MVRSFGSRHDAPGGCWVRDGQDTIRNDRQTGCTGKREPGPTGPGSGVPCERHQGRRPWLPRLQIVCEGGLPVIAASLEEVLALHPDVVVGDSFVSPPTRAALERMNIALVQLPIAQSVEQSRAQVRQLAQLAGHPERGEALLARIDGALARAAPPPDAAPVSAVVWQSGGIVPGPDSLIGDMLRRTGFRNLAAEHGMKQADFLPLEAMLADPPQVILAAGNTASQEDRLLSHPALVALRGTRREALAPSLLWCGGPSMARTAERLGAIRGSL